jgi:flagellar export protein FliJ
MTRDTRTRLRDLARHDRDEVAAQLRRLEGRLMEIDESLQALLGELARSEVAVRERLTDPFDREATVNYIAGLRDREESLQDQRVEVTTRRDEVRASLEKRVVKHRQMDKLVENARETEELETVRQDELASDDLASGHWHQVKENNGD